MSTIAMEFPRGGQRRSGCALLGERSAQCDGFGRDPLPICPQETP